MTELPDHINPLKAFTDARIGLGLTGASVPHQHSLGFKLAHAHARDAVYSVLDTQGLTAKLQVFDLPVLHLYSQANNRSKYLHRPDLGRKLNKNSLAVLKDQPVADVVIIIADGLSATAVNHHAVGLLKLLVPKLQSAAITIGPVSLVEQGRVAVGDDIGHHLKAKLTLLLIGERPGLSAADSVGAYLTYKPMPGLTDESRNCVSNIRPAGLNYKHAADKLFYLIHESLTRKLSGVELKDNTGLLDR